MIPYFILCYLTLGALEIWLFLFYQDAVSVRPAQAILALFVLVVALHTVALRRAHSKALAAVRRIVLAYLIGAFVVHVVFTMRPATYVQVLAGWGAVYVLARPARLSHLYLLAWGYLAAMAVVSIIAYKLGFTTMTVMPVSGGGTLQVNLGYVDQKHTTAAIGFVLFCLSLHRFRCQRCTSGVAALGLALGSYFVVLSYSRGFLLATVLFVLGYLLLYPMRLSGIAVFLGILLPTAVLTLLVISPAARAVIPHFLASTLGTDRGANLTVVNDVTSNRLWLWYQHLAIFKANVWFGAGKFSLQDLITGPLPTSMKMASESFFTYALARDGILGVVQPIIFIQMIYTAKRMHNRFGYAFAFALLSLAATLGYGTNLYTPMTFLLYIIYFASYSNIARLGPGTVLSKTRT